MKLILSLVLMFFSASAIANDFSTIGEVEGDRPIEAVCEPWPDCWDVRENPEEYLESQKNGSTQSGPNDITTTEIINASTNLSCLQWRIIGGCVWYTWPSSIDFTVKIKHYIPDYVISSYQSSGENPWQLMKWIDEPGNQLIKALTGIEPGGGKILSKGRGAASTDIVFKNTTAIGNPLASVWKSLGLYYLMCESEAQSFMPAFSSSFDNLAWRLNPIEALMYAPAQLALQKNRIAPSGASWPSKWGFLYPRTGFVITNDDLKAAAVTAYRTASIVTSQGSNAMMHIANRPPMRSRSGYWPPKTVKENSTSQGYFQMLLPKKESKCRLIADMGSSASVVSDLSPWRSRDGNYVWNFWRPYKCCKRGGSSLIMHFGE